MAREPRERITVRLARAGIRWMDDLAVENPGIEMDRSAVVRAALAVARRHEAELIETIREQM
jgi:Arc/MetJ-type ribon-helix-helix transcriptional regulator